MPAFSVLKKKALMAQINKVNFTDQQQSLAPQGLVLTALSKLSECYIFCFLRKMELHTVQVGLKLRLSLNS